MLAELRCLFAPAPDCHRNRSPELGSLIPRSTVERILTAMVGSAMVAGIYVQRLIDEASSDQCGHNQIGRDDIGYYLAPAFNRRSRRKKRQQSSKAQPRYTIGRTNILDHNDAPPLGPPAPFPQRRPRGANDLIH